jgi:GT2 family glycosyltransferase
MTPSVGKPLVSVVVLSYNSANHLPHCLKSVFSQNYQNLEVILVDNASEDESIEVAKKFPKVKIIANVENLGFSGGMNLGYSKSRGDFVLLLNPDTVLPRNFLSALVKAALRSAKIAIVGSVQNKKRGDIKGGSGAAFFVRRACFGNKLYDPDYFLYAEEDYLYLRCWARGFKSIDQGEAFFKHEMAASSVGIPKWRKFYLQERNSWLNKLRFFSAGFLLRKMPFLLFNWLKKFFFALLTINIDLLYARTASIAWLILNPLPVLRKRRESLAEKKTRDEEIWGKYTEIFSL